jgi:hypothetical protein
MDFDLPYPPTDTIYVPKCPQCGGIVDGYEDAADHRRRNREAIGVCEEVENELERLIHDSRNTRKGVPEGTALGALQQLTEGLYDLSHYASNKSEELIEND